MTAKTANPVDKHVGRVIRQKRLFIKASQTDLGDALGVTFQQIQKYEKGTNRIGTGRLVEIAAFFNCPIEDFVAGAPQHGVKASASAQGDEMTAFFSSRDGVRIAQAWQEIPVEKRNHVVSVIEGIANSHAAMAEKLAIRKVA